MTSASQEQSSGTPSRFPRNTLRACHSLDTHSRFKEWNFMRELRVIDVDGSVLIVASPEGEEFRVPLDDAALLRLKQHRTSENGVRVSPKEIQSRLRAGLSEAEVAQLTGASLELISRFSGPVLAEREHIVASALAISTSPVGEGTHAADLAFGDVISERLDEREARDVRWTSWKADNGTWVIKLEFTMSGLNKDARWSFDPRKHALNPLNDDATDLSRRHSNTSSLIPRLRAVESATEPQAPADDAPRVGLRAVDHGETRESFDSPVDNERETEHSPTADLLEALRRRRSERESSPTWLRESVSEPEVTVSSDATVSLEETVTFTEPFERDVVDVAEEPAPPIPSTRATSRSRRPAMPSWDEIVFGTRSDDDPA
jgi:hypothetical protein